MAPMTTIETVTITRPLKIDEFELRVPWGHVACKRWGPKNIRQIICLHRRQDNAGSFDRFIPFLPNHLSYLGIEFPGNGHSSPIPHGMIYTHLTFFYVLLLVIKQFQWEKVSIIAHSLGAMIGYMFASAFPDRCDMLITLEITKSNSLTSKYDLQFLFRDLNQHYVDDTRNQEQTEPPSYAYNELMEKLVSSKIWPMYVESAPFLLYRGIRPSKSDPNKFFFSRDSRLKPFAFLMPVELYEDMAKRITSPFCFVKAQQSYFREYFRIVEIMKANPNFELYKVEGTHHVHVDEPKTVGALVSKFINKHRPMHGKL